MAASNADLEAKFPSDWAKADPTAIPGMAFASPISQAPKTAAGAENVVVGQVKNANNPTLLPAGFLSALGLDPGRCRRARRSSSPTTSSRPTATRTCARAGSTTPVTLFTVPTSAGVATVACVDPKADCESIANTLKLNAGTAFPVGPSKEYAAGLGKTLGTLDKKVWPAARHSEGAATPKAQAAAAKDLSAAYKSRGGVDLEARGVARRQRRQPAARGGAEADGQRLRQARRRGDLGQQRAYKKAGAGAAGEQAVAGALKGLEAAGYKLAQ